MTFALPWLLLGLLALPPLVVAYRRLLRRRERRHTELASLGLVTSAPARPARARHLAPLLLLGALTLLLLSLARPAATVADLRREGTVILAFDVSTSMRADDLAPTRIDAAKAAARAFVQEQPPSVRIGVVAFNDSGVITQAPTTVQADVVAAIDRMTPAGGTSLGQGIFSSLKAAAGGKLTLGEAALDGDLEDADIGYFGSSVVVLLSDGENTAALDPLKLAELASVAGVRIDTVGIGSADGAVVKVDGMSLATTLDEAMLTSIAEATDGTYYPAADETTLAQIYETIDLELTSTPRPTEVTALFTLAALALLLASAAVSLRRTGRVMGV
ncbi:MAG TPA: VWA domain-containing protein [Candidatus Lustribacter sp.]|nr:VWA domain-containing protein [Candidatus Lustribacter sp.]